MELCSRLDRDFSTFKLLSDRGVAEAQNYRMTINDARSKFSKNQSLIGLDYKGTPIADILIVPKGVGLN